MSQGFNRKIILLFLFLSACTAPLTDLPLFSQEIAHIDDFVLKEDVLRFRLKLELDKYPAEFFNENGGRSTKNPQFLAIVEDLTNKIITDYTIIAYGKRHKIEIDPTELENQVSERQRQTNPKSFENFLNEKSIPFSRWKQLVEDELRVRYVMQKELYDKIKVTSDEVAEYYRKNSSEFDVPERVHVRQIVTDTLEKANDIHKRLLGGENFAKLAVDHSVSPDRAKGGDLGYFARGTFPKEFDETCFSLQKGEISPVVKSDYGYHIFKLLDIKPAGRKDLTEVAAQIEQNIFGEKIKRAYTNWITQVRSEVKVTFDKKVLDSLVI